LWHNRFLRPELLELLHQQQFPLINSDWRSDTAYFPPAFKATEFMLEQIKSAAKSLLNILLCESYTDNVDIYFMNSDFLHSRGIAVRHLGRLMAEVTALALKPVQMQSQLEAVLSEVADAEIYEEEDCDAVAKTILSDIVARTLKNMLRAQMRTLLAEKKDDFNEIAAKELVAEFLNKFFGSLLPGACLY
jgi:hypothetical protein